MFRVGGETVQVGRNNITRDIFGFFLWVGWCTLKYFNQGSNGIRLLV